jgi:uncharacterized membrane protein
MKTQITYDQSSEQPIDVPSDDLVRLAHIIYALHTASVIIGIASSATIVGAFVFGIPSIVAVILNYVKRSDVRGTFLESHFRWQIRTFWFALLWIVIAALMIITVIGMLFGFGIIVGAGLWVIYRIARGWLALRDRRELRFFESCRKTNA